MHHKLMKLKAKKCLFRSGTPVALWGFNAINGQPESRMMKGQLPIEIATKPSTEVEENFSAMLNLLADALADQFIAQARTEVASRLGIDASLLEREHNRIAIKNVGDIRSHPMVAGGNQT
ncbi:MAG: hypothetical protein HQL90_08630 [Magnetococcales bacterium]|nr:hypothetical protein [Magnetococcales bacterium]